LQVILFAFTMSGPGDKKITKADINNQVRLGKTIWVGKPKMGFEKAYEKGAQLGNAGQYGVTHRCTKMENGQTYAVKFLNKNRFYRIEPKFRQRYMESMSNEIAILQQVKHKNIIRLHEVWEDKTTLYLVMEECTGGELFKRIVAKGKFTELDASKVIYQLLSALRYMHDENNRIVHCDLKPDNILFLTQDDDSPVKIIDFGMSKILPPLESLNLLCGTPYYTAPEVIQDKKYDHTCDLWSLGVILFVMVFGYPPFYVDPKAYGNNERNAIYRKICKGFSPEIKSTQVYGYGPWFPDHIPSSDAVRDLIAKLLSRKPRKRYTAKEALTHEWITNNAKVADKRHLSMTMMSRLMHFNNVCHFKLVITKIFRNQFYKMRPEHFHQLEELFKQYDANGDGMLTFKEFCDAIEKSNVDIDQQSLKKVFEGLMASQQLKDNDGGQNVEDEKDAKDQEDKSKPNGNVEDEKDAKDQEDKPKSNGNVEDEKDQGDKPKANPKGMDPLSMEMGIKFSDLLNALVYDYLIACDERLYDAFRKLDDDNDGFITANELKAKLKQIDPLGEWDRAIKIIDDSMTQNNGLIDYEEFLLNLHPKYNETPEWMPDVMKKMQSVAFIDKPKFKSPRKKKSKK